MSVTLTDEQFTQLLNRIEGMAHALATSMAGTAQGVADVAAALNRQADVITGILLHLDPKNAGKYSAPGYQRPLGAYKNFNWASIDADVITSDDYGPSEVEHNGQAYRRYNSRADDPRGVDIRFRRVVSGTPETKDMVWATLIKFADKKQRPAPRKLSADVREALADAPTVIDGQARQGGAGLALAAPAATKTTGHITGGAGPGQGGAGYQSPASVPAPGPGPAATPNWAVANALRNLLMGDATRWGQNRPPSAGTRQLVYLTLKQAATGNDTVLHAFIDFVFGAVSYKDLTSGAVWALQAWLKPAGVQNSVYAAANADAASLVALVAAAHALQENPPAAAVPAHA